MVIAAEEYSGSPVPSASKTEMLNAAKGGSKVKVAKTQSTQGYTKLPVVGSPISWQDADYYRNGKADKADGYNAKTLDPFPEGPASIRVFGKGTGKNASKSDRDFIPAYTKFILNATQEGHQERVQIVETFSDFYVFFYGERPPIYTYSGMLVNAKNANWFADFMYYYEEHLRGTKCAENNARLILTYGGRQVEGYILSVNLSTTAETEHGVPISFQVVVTKRNRVGFSDDFGVSFKKGSMATDDDLRKMLEKVAGPTGKGTSNKETSTAYNSVKASANALKPAAMLV